MESPHAGSTLESPNQFDQLDQRELLDDVESVQIERQESMFDGTAFDETGFDNTVTADDTSFEVVKTLEHVNEAADENPDSLQQETPEAFPHVAGAHIGSDAVESHVTIPLSVVDHANWQPEQEPVQASEEDAGLAKILTADDFSALEERVLKAVGLVRRERDARIAAEERLLLLESQVLAQAPAVEQLHQEIDSLRAEREQVRLRVERLLSQLDALEL